MATVLIVDDSPQMVDLLQEMTRLLGHQTQVAGSGPDGLRRARTLSPDLILLDLMMPGMDGWMFYERLREFSQVPVIIVTATDTPRNRAKADEVGVAAMLGKEVTPDVLRAEIKQVLNAQ